MSREPSAPGGAPRLAAVTRSLAEIPDIVALADAERPLLWTRGDRGCVGIGEALRLSFSGPDRFAEAARTWREIAAHSVVDDPVQLPGTGLAALGTFAFDDESGAESVLIVPRTIVARHRGAAWATRISRLDEERSTIAVRAASDAAASEAADPRAAVPEAAEVRSWQGVTLSSTPAPEGAERDPATNAYLEGVRLARQRIERGELEKVVLARQASVDIPADADLRVPLARLAERYTDCWTFAVDGLIGASPETLVRSTDGAVSARVLAGTRRRHPEAETLDIRARNELLTNAKEQHEHEFAVQSVVTALAPHVRGMHTSDEPFTLRLPNVWHLATDLGAALAEDSSSLEIAGALHPTAAVAGTPTAAAIAAIAELEPFDRGRYAGAVGWIDDAGDGEWVIALRCAQIGAATDTSAGSRVRTVTATAGGGILSGSNPENELGETVSKFRPITDALA